MSILYTIAVKCDRCDDTEVLDEDCALPTKEPKKLPPGWKKKVVEDDQEWGHTCPRCTKEIKEQKAAARRTP